MSQHVTCAESLNKVSTWCKANKLTMNCKKTKYMVVKYKKTPEVPDVIVRDKHIGLVHSYEYLGILLDEKSFPQ